MGPFTLNNVYGVLHLSPSQGFNLGRDAIKVMEKCGIDETRQDVVIRDAAKLDKIPVGKNWYSRRHGYTYARSGVKLSPWYWIDGIAARYLTGFDDGSIRLRELNTSSHVDERRSLYMALILAHVDPLLEEETGHSFRNEKFNLCRDLTQADISSMGAKDPIAWSMLHSIRVDR